MKKLIRVSTDLKVTIHDYPEGGAYRTHNEAFRKLIGEDCELYEIVKPKRLYTRILTGLGMKNKRTPLVMLVDEEGLLKKLESNMLGSWLYMTDRHGCPIAGNVLFVGTEYSGMGIDICGIQEDIAEALSEELKKVIERIAG